MCTKRSKSNAYAEFVISRYCYDIVVCAEICFPANVSFFKLGVVVRDRVESNLCMAVFGVGELEINAEGARDWSSTGRTVIQKDSSINVDVCVERLARLDGLRVVGSGRATASFDNAEGGESSVHSSALYGTLAGSGDMRIASS
jgi:hypothetical protein